MALSPGPRPPRSPCGWDRQDPTGATVDLEVSTEGCPAGARAERPRMVGNQTILTPWSAICGEFREYEGIRFATRLEVTWHLPEGPFVYFREEVTEFTILR